MAKATAMDLQEQVAGIERAQAETRKFVAESNELTAEMFKLALEHMLAPRQVAAASVAATAALIGAGATLAKLFG
jgi:hypothetical protein